MLKENEIKGIIIKPEKDIQLSSRLEVYHELPEEYKERYILYSNDLNILGYIGVQEFNNLIKMHINLYEKTVNLPEIQNIGIYLDDKAKVEFEKDRIFIIHVDILVNSSPIDDKTVCIHYQRFFLVRKQFNEKMNIAVMLVTDKNDVIEYINSFSEYFNKEIPKPILSGN